jgi:hypothetical protein
MERLSRRAVLGAGASTFVALGGCTTADNSAPRPTQVPSPDELLMMSAAEAEARLLDQYAAIMLAHPDLVEPLAPYVRRHEEHREAVRGAAGEQTSPRPTGTRASATAHLTDRGSALTALAEAEADATAARRSDCLRVQAGETARLLASIAACEGLHQATVTQL